VIEAEITGVVDATPVVTGVLEELELQPIRVEIPTSMINSKIKIFFTFQCLPNFTPRINHPLTTHPAETLEAMCPPGNQCYR
jgi:hypothetical protein